MNATFVAELLVGGVLTITWLALAVMTMAGAEPVLKFFGTNPLGSTAILGVYAYALGVIMDRLWDRLTKPLDRRIRRKIFPEEKDYLEVRGRVLSSKDHREFFKYIRSRIRITRSCLCSFPLIGATGVAACYIGTENGRAIYVVIAAAFSLVLCLISWVAYNDVVATYYKEMKKLGQHRPAGYGSAAAQ